jgi:hypothetical protein
MLEQRLSLGVVLVVPLPQQPMATYQQTQVHLSNPCKHSQTLNLLSKWRHWKEMRTLAAGTVVPVPRERPVEVGYDLRK